MADDLFGIPMDIANTLTGGLLGFGTSVAQGAISYDQQKSLMRLQHNLNMAAWEKQTEYNTPANQMKRLQAAGLNPNLVYGNGANNTASSAPQVSGGQAPKYSPIDWISLYAMANQAQLSKAQQKKTDEERKGISIQNQIAEQDLKLKQMDVVRAENSNPAQMGLNDLEQSTQNILKTKSDIERNNYINALNKAQTTFQEIENSLKQKYGDVEYGLKVSSIAIQNELNELERDNFSVKLQSYLGLNAAQAQAAMAAAAASQALASKYFTEINNLEAENYNIHKQGDKLYWESQQAKEKVLQEEYRTGLLGIDKSLRRELTEEQINKLKSGQFRDYFSIFKK